MDKFWLDNYPDIIEHNIDPNDFTNLGELLRHCCEKHPELPAFTCFGVSLSFAELDDLSARFAHFLSSKLKLRKGNKLAIMLPNILQFPVVMFAALRLGIVIVNVNPLYTTPELTHQMNDSGAKTIVVMDRFAHIVQSAMPKTPLENVVVTGFGDLLGFKGSLINIALRFKQVPKWSIKSALSFKSAIKSSPIAKDADISPSDLAFLQYTGGTTGVAKGAMLSHSNIVANILQLYAWVEPFHDKEIGTVIEPLPMYHIYSLTVSMTFMYLASNSVLIPNPRDRAGFVKLLRKTKFSLFVGLNTLFNSLVHDPDFNKIDFSSLKHTIAGGMAMQESVANQWKAVTGTVVIQAYGLTETSPAVCANLFDSKEFSGNVGLPLPSTHIAIMDENNKELGCNEVGELCVKGPQVMQGYWRREKETKATIIDGWLHTGDMASINDKGEISIVDRKKDMIIVSGFNVYPNEVEDVIATHPDVVEVAVIGVESSRTGEAVKAYIVPESDSLTEEALIKYCRKHLTAYKVPKLIQFKHELPKSNVGKILRRELRDDKDT
jgi:long-chain acyl-CoA synthetase